MLLNANKHLDAPIGNPQDVILLFGKSKTEKPFLKQMQSSS
jgi:hypothetical protein